MMLRLSRMIASLFYVGFIPGMPGTYGSIITSFAFYTIYRLTGRIAPELHIGALCLICLAGVLAAAKIEHSTGVEDPSYIIIDEVAGQLITLAFLPVTLPNIILGTLAFRIFDIWKPFPIRKLESLGKGVGVMADDLLAGIYGNIVLHLINLIL
jgi:phosphatidylglycerophosphatase A